MNAIDRVSSDVIGASLTKVLEPIGLAHGLPNAFYTDAAVFDSEKDRVFAGTPERGREWGLPPLEQEAAQSQAFQTRPTLNDHRAARRAGLRPAPTANLQYLERAPFDFAQEARLPKSVMGLS